MKWSPTEKQLLCRDLQHAWTPHSAHSEGKGFVRTLRCQRCRSVKHQILDRDGYIISTRMVYPVGYLRPGEGRMTRDERAELRVRNM